jgi:hypothetical protein
MRFASIRKENKMDNRQEHEKESLTKSLWNAIFAGTRLRHVSANDQRVFVLKSIVWDRQESKVIDTATGEVFRFPWDQLEFLDPVNGNLPGLPAAPKTL